MIQIHSFHFVNHVQDLVSTRRTWIYMFSWNFEKEETGIPASYIIWIKSTAWLVSKNLESCVLWTKHSHNNMKLPVGFWVKHEKWIFSKIHHPYLEYRLGAFKVYVISCTPHDSFFSFFFLEKNVILLHWGFELVHSTHTPMSLTNQAPVEGLPMTNSLNMKE